MNVTHRQPIKTEEHQKEKRKNVLYVDKQSMVGMLYTQWRGRWGEIVMLWAGKATTGRGRRMARSVCHT
jgi:hypothetical protein